MKNHFYKMWGDKPYYSLNYYLKETFGEKVYRLSLNAGLTCPNRDGTLDTRGCIFCSHGGSGDFAEKMTTSVTTQIEAAKKQVMRKSSCKKFIAYFQAYTNTYGELSYLKQIFTEAIQHPDIVILSIATRPDCLSEEILELLSDLNKYKPVWIELGLQTIHQKTSAFIRSGFSLSCFSEAVHALTIRNIPIIAHVILGLPGESKIQMLQTVDYLADLNIFGIKLQLLHILKGTDLYEYYKVHPFPLFTLEEYSNFILECLEHLPPEMIIHRITGDGPKHLLEAPLWSTDKKKVLNHIHKNLKTHHTCQGRQYIANHATSKINIIN